MENVNLELISTESKYLDAIPIDPGRLIAVSDTSNLYWDTENGERKCIGSNVTVCNKVPDQNGNIVLTAEDIEAISALEKGRALGVAETDADNKVLSQHLPSNLLTYEDGAVGEVVPIDADTLGGETLEEIKTSIAGVAEAAAEQAGKAQVGAEAAQKGAQAAADSIQVYVGDAPPLDGSKLIQIVDVEDPQDGMAVTRAQLRELQVDAIVNLRSAKDEADQHGHTARWTREQIRYAIETGYMGKEDGSGPMYYYPITISTVSDLVRAAQESLDGSPVAWNNLTLEVINDTLRLRKSHAGETFDELEKYTAQDLGAFKASMESFAQSGVVVSADPWYQVQNHLLYGKPKTDDAIAKYVYWWKDGSARPTVTLKQLLAAEVDFKSNKILEFNEFNIWLTLSMIDIDLSFRSDDAGTKFIESDMPDVEDVIQRLYTKVYKNPAYYDKTAKVILMSWDQVQYYLINGIVPDQATVGAESDAKYTWRPANHAEVNK